MVIEVDDGKYDANLGPQFEQQAKQRNRVGTSRNGSAYAVPGFQKRVFADIGEDGGGEGLHRNMVHLGAGAGHEAGTQAGYRFKRRYHRNSGAKARILIDLWRHG